MTDLPDLLVEPLVRAALMEDLSPSGDVTTRAVIPAGTQMVAKLNSRASGCVSGLQLARIAFRLVDPTLTIRALAQDGDACAPKQLLMEISGDAGSILMAERVALNFAGRMSGVATLTAAFVRETRGTHARITCTRKTTPGLRMVEKAAVRHGGGSSHRYSLADAILIKDNHIVAAGSVRAALSAAKAARSHMMRVEIEVDRLSQLEDVLSEGGADVVLLDNMTTANMAEAVKMVAGRIVTEASGNMSLPRIAEVAATGVDYISVGALTHSAPVLDLGLDAV